MQIPLTFKVACLKREEINNICYLIPDSIMTYLVFRFHWAL